MKAFDKVPHKHLLTKLKMYGISGQIHSWVSEFLHDRQQLVRVNSELSDWRPVTSGIPQGSVLGPCLFIVYINDLPEAINNSQAFLFADDLKLFKEIVTQRDCELLQEDLNEAVEWSQTSQLLFHPQKCKHMQIATRAKEESHAYKMAGLVIETSQEERDLGVIIDSKLKFDSHIQNKINKANSVLGVIKRTFEYKDKSTLLILYKALVRPHIEFVNQVWAPHLVKHITSIENVQRRFTKIIPGLINMSYEERLKELNLPTLSYRRARGDAIEYFKIIKGHYDPKVTDNLFQLDNTMYTRGNNYKIKKERVHLDIRKYSFFHRFVDTWNSIPNNVIECETIKQFEGKLDKYWRQHPLKFDYRASPARSNFV